MQIRTQFKLFLTLLFLVCVAVVFISLYFHKHTAQTEKNVQEISSIRDHLDNLIILSSDIAFVFNNRTEQQWLATNRALKSALAKAISSQPDLADELSQIEIKRQRITLLFDRLKKINTSSPGENVIASDILAMASDEINLNIINASRAIGDNLNKLHLRFNAMESEASETEMLVHNSLFILLITVSFLFLWITSKTILTSIARLKGEVKKISHGNYQVNIVLGRNEIGDLGNEFNQMALRLRRRDEENQKITSELEQRVKELKMAETELTRQEQFLNLILESIPSMIFVKDAETLKFVRFNKAGEELLGIPREEMLGKSDRDFFPENQAEFFISKDQEVLKNGEVLDIPQEQIETKSLGQRILHTRKIGIYDENGRPAYLLGISEDITDKTEAETAIIAARKAEASNKAKSAFLANMSHEIRTPMNGVVGMSEILSRTELQPEQRRMIRTIRDSSESLLRIIDDILDLSKIEAGKLQLEKAPLCMRELSEGVITTLRPIARSKNVRLQFDLRPHPPFIDADVIRLRQILMNLLNNAIKFSKGQEGSNEGWVNLVVERSGDNEIRFIVADNGIGMSAEAVAKLFKPFTQAEDSTTRKYGGTGLGLAITKTLVDMMGGMISVESTPNSGTAFTVTLPVSETDGPNKDPDISGLRILALVGGDINQEKLEQYLTNAEAELRFVKSEEDLSSTLHQAEAGTIVLLALPTAAENDSVRSRLSDESGLIRYLSLVDDFNDSSTCALPDCYMVLKSPVLPSELIHGLAVLAGRASPDVEYGVASESVTGPAVGSGEHRLVLLVEDNETNQEVITTQLDLLGLGVEVAANGIEGLALWKSGRFDLVLTDCHMPEMDGFEMTAEIRKQEKARGENRIPVIAITANALKGESERCLAAGMDDYLSKPVALNALQKTLEQWLSQDA